MTTISRRPLVLLPAIATARRLLPGRAEIGGVDRQLLAAIAAAQKAGRRSQRQRGVRWPSSHVRAPELVSQRTRRSGRRADCRTVIPPLRKPAATAAPPSLAATRLASRPAFICAPPRSGEPGLRSIRVSGRSRDETSYSPPAGLAALPAAQRSGRSVTAPCVSATAGTRRSLTRNRSAASLSRAERSIALIGGEDQARAWESESQARSRRRAPPIADNTELDANDGNLLTLSMPRAHLAADMMPDATLQSWRGAVDDGRRLGALHALSRGCFRVLGARLGERDRLVDRA